MDGEQQKRITDEPDHIYSGAGSPPADRAAIRDLVVKGLYATGAHHKQWYLEQVLRAVSGDFELVRSYCEMDAGAAWTDGIAP